MKFLAFGDTHGSKQAIDIIEDKIKNRNPEFIVCCGDMTIFENDLKKIIYHISSIAKGRKVFLIHGNHEQEKVVKKICSMYDNLEFMHGRILKFKDIVILGWGGGGFTITDNEFEEWLRSVRKELKEYIKEGKKILFIGHAPVYGTRLDLLSKEHRGNKSFYNFIKEFSVDVTICGHFHENNGREDTIGKLRVYNPGPKGKMIEILGFE